MLRWSVYVVLGLGAAIAMIAVGGYALPQGHRASRTRTIAAAPADVFAVVSNFAGYPAWRTGVRGVTVDGSGGRGSLVREEGADGVIPYRVEVFDPPHRMVMRIEDASLPFGGAWTYELRAVADGTAVTITEDGEVYNPIFRVLSRFVFGHHATIDRFLEDLADRLKQQ